MVHLLQLREPGQTPDPHDGVATIAIGIDLGTTHSVAAVVINGTPHVLNLDEGQALIPSIVSYNQGVCVGRVATQFGCPLSSTKRLMGRGCQDAIISCVPHAMTVDDQVVLRRGDGTYVTPVEVAADILRHIRTQAEDFLESPITDAVITVPAYFDEGARNATKDAARLAGLNVLRLINEPTAAALAYGLDRGLEGIYAIYDWGGGTFDISLLRLQKGVFQVLSTGGDVTLGGDDVDHALLAYLGESDFKYLPLIRQAKEALSEQDTAIFLMGNQSHTLTRQDVEAAAHSLVAKTLEISARVLKDAGVTPNQIQGVVFVGGSTRMPLVRSAVKDFFGQDPLSDIDPDQAVALGAALQAHGLTSGSGNLLLDVNPLSLGLETYGGLVEKLIPRNSPLPAHASEEFTTFEDGQTALAVHIVQGERELVEDCRSLARFELSGIPPLPAGIARIKIDFMVDADGLLTVAATEMRTGLKQHIEVKPSYGLDMDQMALMLEDSLKNGRADMERRLLQEAKVEGQRLIHDLTSALKEDGDVISGDERAQLEDIQMMLVQALESDDRTEITKAHDVLEKASQPFAEARMNKRMKAALVGTII